MTLKSSRVFALLVLPVMALHAAQAAQISPGANDTNGKGYAEVEWVRTPRPPVPAASSPKPDLAVLTTLKAEPGSEWTVELADQTFYQTLLRWCRSAGWQLVWEADRDFAIDAQVTLQGNFLFALDQSMQSLRETDFPVQARVNPETRVVRVVRYLMDGDRR